MKIGDLNLVNEEKLNRAISGSMTRGGVLSGGVGENASDEAILAAYDKLGGLILKDDCKVKSGCFYDFEKKCAKEKVELVFVEELDGELVEMSEDEIKAVKKVKEKVKDVKEKVKKRKKK